MIAHYRITSFGGSTSFIALHGTANLNFGPPVSASPDCWTERSFLVETLTVHASTAPGVGDTHTQQYFEGSTQLGSSLALTGTATEASGEVNATVPVSVDATVGSSHAFKTTPSGTPAVAAAGLFTHLYELEDDPEVSFFPFGDGATNMIFPGSSTFIGFYGVSFNASEGLRQTIMPMPGTLERFFCRYVSAAATTFTIDIRVNGATIDTITIPAHSGSGAFVAETIDIPHVAGDLISFRVNRTVGSGTNFVMYALLTWRPD